MNAVLTVALPVLVATAGILAAFGFPLGWDAPTWAGWTLLALVADAIVISGASLLRTGTTRRVVVFFVVAAVTLAAGIVAGPVGMPNWISAVRYDRTLPTTTACVDLHTITEVAVWHLTAKSDGHVLGTETLVYSARCHTVWIKATVAKKGPMVTKQLHRVGRFPLWGATTPAVTDPTTADADSFGDQLYATGCLTVTVTVRQYGVRLDNTPVQRICDVASLAG